MDLQHITYEVADRIATITLNRPDQLNAFTARMTNELLAAFDEIDRDDDVRAVIMTGAGRGFCAGADLSEGASTFEYTSARAPGDDRPSLAERDAGGLVSLRIFDLTKPIIAAVNGAAVGVGVTMTLPMDVRMASTTARFGFVFSKRGIVPEAASSWFLPRVVGISQALEWTYTGRIFDADEALAGGLVRSLHAPEDLLPAARALATEIATDTSAVSVAMTRQMLWRMLGQDHPMAAHRVDSRAVPQLGAMADAREGVTSFLEKRRPVFTLGPANDMPDVYPWFETPNFDEDTSDL